MQLTYVTAFNYKNIHNWSGLGFYYEKMLCNAGFQKVHSIDVTEKSLPLQPLHWLELKFNALVLRKSRPALFNLAEARHFAAFINSREHSPHVISPNTAAIVGLNSYHKKILYTDSTLENLLSCYANYHHLDSKTVTESQELEAKAISEADLLIYTSSWAASSAIDDYGADPAKVSVIPFGANMRVLPSALEVEAIIQARHIKEQIHLLFVGIDWERKGGERAVQVARNLNQAGYPTTLHMVGIKNLRRFTQESFVVDYGYISKQLPEGERQLRQLMSKCNFLILPSLADCTPVVFSEASAFGLPCLATDVGGNSGIIRPDVNGRTFALPTFVGDAVAYIGELSKDPDAYLSLCRSTFQVYQTELNWSVTGKKIYDLVSTL